jgi:hypothetical protein
MSNTSGFSLFSETLEPNRINEAIVIDVKNIHYIPHKKCFLQALHFSEGSARGDNWK